MTATERAALAAHQAAIAAEQAATAARAATGTFEHGHASDTRIAVIGLVGALIGGVLTGGTQLLADWRKRTQERAEKAEHVRGVGRALHHYLNIWEILARYAPDRNEWWAQGSEPAAHWDSDDIQIVAGMLSGAQWEAVRGAVTAAKNLSDIRAVARESRLDPQEMFKRPGVDFLRELEWLEKGAETLREVFG